MDKYFWICPNCNTWNRKVTATETQATNFTGAECEHCDYRPDNYTY